ncbi:CatA-like O-acetyltransferase [Isoptericola sp. NPDC057191]|uniref:CatA-like O-acetyltransferase n=1 Tax=Isoptericola sp. NPDC057191 TaxID=3346041 RepID=UPI003639FAF5
MRRRPPRSTCRACRGRRSPGSRCTSGTRGGTWRIFTLGRYVERDGRVLLPLAVQVHHAVADGFHTARLVNELQELLADPAWVG